VDEDIASRHLDPVQFVFFETLGVVDAEHGVGQAAQ
jgi:hypothetical protein